MNMLRKLLLLTTGIVCLASMAEARVVEYNLTVEKTAVNITGKPALAMTINGKIPGPTLHFHEGDTALIHVHNRMDVGTSIHWHGMLVPPRMDGVPYISFPPIAPDSTFTYTFPIRQQGTYWYHSHSGLQEQKGVYGAIVIEPEIPRISYDRDEVVVLSDWTNMSTHAVMRQLKRGSEWFSIQKGAAQSVVGALRVGKIGDFIKRELLRMPPMDMSDVAYDRFLANGTPELQLDGKPGETIRIRIVDGSSTTYFYLQYAGGPMKVITADGQDVQPFEINRLLIAVAETYDVLVKVPDSGACELRATAHDGSAFASIWIGSGRRIPAPAVPRPNTYYVMGGLSFGRVCALTPAGSMGMTDHDVNAGRFDQPGMAGMTGMPGMKMGKMSSQMSNGSDTAGMPGMKMGPMSPPMPTKSDTAHMAMPSMSDTASMAMPKEPANMSMMAGGDAMPGMPATDSGGMNMSMAAPSVPIDPELRNGKRFGWRFAPLASDVSSANQLAVDGMSPERPGPPYTRLRSTHPTSFDPTKPVHVVRLTLDGDMERYIWMINNKTLAESDSIVIHKGEIVRFIMINRTMMHHPMHLHGHFFRVINGQGEYSPLKHTVDVAPMTTTVIEFDANEFGEWFFHCHLLYHLNSGMARTVHYEGYSLPPSVVPVRPKLYHVPWYFWASGDVLSNMTDGAVVASSTRNILVGEWEVGWHNRPGAEWEGILTGRRYINRFLTFFVGGDFYGAKGEETNGLAVGGLYYLLPLNIDSRTWVAHDLSVRFAFEKELMLMPRLGIYGESEYDTDLKWQGTVRAVYTINRTVSLTGRWHSDYGWGGGLTLRL